ncbi:MAG: hypothetical protein ABH885_05020 [Candidatus Omnitrophota bacterium]
MEEAIFISRPGGLRHFSGRHKRIYFGNEFCQRLIPSFGDIDIVADFAAENNVPLTIVTPFVTDEGLRALKYMLAYATGNDPGLEIVVNDWGVMSFVKDELGCQNLVLGRLLTKQKRGPRILNLKGRVPESMMGHFMESACDTEVFSDFLVRNNVGRVEFDNLLQGLIRPGGHIRGSLYYPYAYVSTTRYCLTASCLSAEPAMRSIASCDKECGQFSFSLSHKSMPVELIMKGNTQFFENTELPGNLEELNIDRLVYQPDIPM